MWHERPIAPVIALLPAILTDYSGEVVLEPWGG